MLPNARANIDPRCCLCRRPDPRASELRRPVDVDGPEEKALADFPTIAWNIPLTEDLLGLVSGSTIPLSRPTSSKEPAVTR